MKIKENEQQKKQDEFSQVEIRLFKRLLEGCLSFEYVGSRVTCSPPPEDTDKDILCLTIDLTMFQELAEAVGFELLTTQRTYAGNRTSIDHHFFSMRKGEINLIITESRVFYDRFMVATRLAKRFNLLEKEDRVALFQGVLYQNG